MNKAYIKGMLPTFLAGLLILAGCEGDTGPAGPEGPPGPPGPPATPVVDAQNAAEINAEITGASITSPPVVDFALSDGNGNPVVNLPADAISFKIAKLTPGTNGNPSAWQSYINRIEEPGVGPGTEPKAQATTENGSAGSLVDNGNGSYQYTFATDVTNVTSPIVVEYDSALTHRITFEVRGLAPVRNPYYDFKPIDGSTSGLFTREIASLDRCNACHEDLSFHGGARFEMQDCVTCHNPGSVDANSGNSVDMAEMTHKIHHGVNLPSVIGGDDYCIYGFNDSIHCYGDVSHPQDVRNCANCHNEEDAVTPNAANWYTVPTDTACGSCHDNVNFETGEGHGSGIPADNSGCVGCHASNPNSSIEVRQAHRILTQERAADFQFNILGVDFMTPGSTPSATISVTDPQNGDAPYDLANDPELTASNIRLRVTWDTVDYNNTGNGASNAQPVSTDLYDNGMLQATDNGDMTYTLPLSPVAATATGSGVITMEGGVTTEQGRAPVTSAFRYFGITDDPMAPVPRRVKVEMERCNDCHEALSFHGDNRNNSIEICQVCHIAEAARGGSPSNGPMDMKHFVHRLHFVDDIRYPQRASNCVACHTDDGYYPVDLASGVLATSFDRGTDPLDPSTNTRASANSTTCGTCHSSPDATAHMTANGGSFDACQEPDGTLRQRVDSCGPGGDKSGALVQETCVVCHGPGRSSDVGIAHGVQ